GQYLQGTAASSLFEARLGRLEMGGETHIYAPAYREDEFDEILSLCDHVVFNSFAQWELFGHRAVQRNVACGMRVNPLHSEVKTALYDPCAPGSRLGTPRCRFPDRLPEGITGLHFHTLCESNADALARTLRAVDRQFGAFLKAMKWVNLGGGHHITRPDYDMATLLCAIRYLQDTYGLTVYLEPGEAVALYAGYLVTRVLDIVPGDPPVAVMDASVACHMPDVLEMPYRPPLLGAGRPGQRPHTFRLAGPTCLAGDVIGDYSFDAPLRRGDPLVLCDMAHYTMVKNNTFNGINLPSIALYGEEKGLRVLRRFGYEDFRGRLS
ncbi:MAG: carboxynorspermidine decarboxylase, partial [Anaerolineaceae bacterium]|nr:carboxynorspermidine decarboxylase [Anaerolineaceae bacterium]